MADRRITITAGRASAEALLNDSRTATAIWDALPIEAAAQTWGDEIYFGIGVKAAEESPRGETRAATMIVRGRGRGNPARVPLP